VVVSFDGRPVGSTAKLRNLTAAAGKGAHVKLEVLRDGERKVLPVQLGEMPATLSGVAKLDRSEGVLGGLTLQGLNRAARSKYGIPDRITRGVVVAAVSPGSPAARAGLRPGDVVLELNRKPVKSAGQLTRGYKATRGKVLLLIYRRGSTMYLMLSK
jgi:serine protease Do